MSSATALCPLHRQVLDSGRWFAGLPPSMQEALCRDARVATLHAGELVFQRGDANDGLYGMLGGAIRFGALKSVLALAEPPLWFGEVALLDGGPRTHHAWAETDAMLAHVPLPAITHWLDANPAHWQYIGRLAVHLLRVVFAAIEDVGLCPPRERLIRCLVSMARGYGERAGTPVQTLRVSQERLGSMLSLSRQTVNALLQGLERERLLVCVRGGVRIVDFERLSRLAASIG